MAQIHRPRGTHTGKPTTTAHLIQTMSLLELNNAELIEKIQSELANNPALEIIEDNKCPTCQTTLFGNMPCSKCSYKPEQDLYDPVVFISPAGDRVDYSNSTMGESSGDDFSPQHEDLPTYLLSQIAADLEVDERKIAAFILTSLDENGFLSTTKEEFARYHHVLPSKIERVLNLIQRSTPLGAGSSSPQEALLVQIKFLSESIEIPAFAEQIIREEYKLLTSRQYSTLSKRLGTTTHKIKKAADFISNNLNPFPARAHWGTVRHQSSETIQRYYSPDAIITLNNDADDPQLFIEILWPIKGNLKLNPAYKTILKEAIETSTDNLKEDLEKAALLIKCLSQRNHTLVRLMEILANQQRDFILNGDAEIKPITRAKIADELGVHEATISRAVAGKSVQLPNKKIIPISKFFDRSLHIRTAMKTIISKEAAPLSDNKIAAILENQGYNIARRTVAKYRSMEGILPASQRA